MNSFLSALDVVHAALRSLHEQGVELRASSASLARLADGLAKAAPAQPEARRPVWNPPVETPQVSESIPAVVEAPRAVVAPEKRANNSGAESSEARLAALHEPAAILAFCPSLASKPAQIVFGLGSAEAEIMFIGDVPGCEEDPAGEPFGGPDGVLLNKIIETMGFPRATVYITTLIKCRPERLADGEPDSRKPSTGELQAALPFLRQQIEIIQPRVLVALGAGVMAGLLGETQPMAKLRGRWHEFEGLPLMATYHPTYLVRNQALTEKRKVWEDMLLVIEKLGRPVSAKQQGYFLPKA
ncbi:MAG: Uracil glycosylase superfamily protein [Chthoniobacteraceae bacterium]|nr:Uracil glycosylase superfamily protein [Chthoniobacteraceae bacterium]